MKLKEKLLVSFLKSIKYLSVFSGILLASVFLAPFLASFLPYDFDRIFRRCVTVGVIGWAIFAFSKTDKQKFKQFLMRSGLEWKRNVSVRLFSQSFIVFFSVMTLLVLLETLGGIRFFEWNVKWKFPIQIIEYSLAALIIGTVEEFFFRGVVFNKLKNVSVAFAYFATNLFYASVHFMKVEDYVPAGTPTFRDSLYLLIHFLTPFKNIHLFTFDIIGLFLFGSVMTWAYRKTSSLYAAIGIHAGAVFFLKIDGFLIGMRARDDVWLYGDKNIYTGICGWIAILIGWMIIKRLFDDNITKGISYDKDQY